MFQVFPIAILLKYSTGDVKSLARIESHLFGNGTRINGGRHARFHIYGTSTVEIPVNNLPAEWRDFPFSLIIDRNGIYMRVKQDGFFSASYSTEEVAH